MLPKDGKGKETTKGGTQCSILGLHVKYTPCLGMSLSHLLFPVVAIIIPRSLQFEARENYQRTNENLLPTSTTYSPFLSITSTKSIQINP